MSECKHEWEVLTPSFEVCVLCKIARYWNESAQRWEYKQELKVKDRDDIPQLKPTTAKLRKFTRPELC